MIKKISNLKYIFPKCEKGMTYVELIVVLGIFSVMTSVVLFNYNTFQARIDIKVLANDIALKIVEAQKSALAGKWNAKVSLDNYNWKPSYGIYFDLSSINNVKSFDYFVNLDNSLGFTDDGNGNFCSLSDAGECLEHIEITKGNKIFSIANADMSGNTFDAISGNLSITFTRPDSSVVFYSSEDPSNPLQVSNYIQIILSNSSDESIKSYIRIYPSGRIQIN